MKKQANVCIDCPYKETCKANCEAYMVLARLTVNIGDFNAKEETWSEEAPRDYLFSLEDDLIGLTVI